MHWFRRMKFLNKIRSRNINKKWFTYFLVMVLDLIVSFETFCCLVLEELIYMQYGTMKYCCWRCCCWLFIWIRDLIWIVFLHTQSITFSYVLVFVLVAHDSVFSWDRYLFVRFQSKWIIKLPPADIYDFDLFPLRRFALNFFFPIFSVLWIWFRFVIWNTEIWIVLCRTPVKKNNNDNEWINFLARFLDFIIIISINLSVFWNQCTRSRF